MFVRPTDLHTVIHVVLHNLYLVYDFLKLGRSQDFLKRGSHCVKVRALTRLSWRFCQLLLVVTGCHGQPRTPLAMPLFLRSFNKLLILKYPVSFSPRKYWYMYILNQYKGQHVCFLFWRFQSQ